MESNQRYGNMEYRRCCEALGIRDLAAFKRAVHNMNAFELDKRLQEFDYKTLLHITARSGEVEFVKVLLDGGAQVDYLDFTQCTALHYACANKHHDVMLLLVQRGACLELQNYNNDTPLSILNSKLDNKGLEMLTDLQNHNVLNQKETVDTSDQRYSEDKPWQLNSEHLLRYRYPTVANLNAQEEELEKDIQTSWKKKHKAEGVEEKDTQAKTESMKLDTQIKSDDTMSWPDNETTNALEEIKLWLKEYVKIVLMACGILLALFI